MVSAERWIVIPNWEKFQHYKDRGPKWIKNYTRLLSNDDYLMLTGNRRALLHGLWLVFASSGLGDDLSETCVRLDVQLLNRRLGLAAKMADYEALNHAGFIALSASKPLSKRNQVASPEVETETEAEKRKKEQEPKAFNEVRNERPPESLSEEEPKPIAALIEQSLAQARLGLVA